MIAALLAKAWPYLLGVVVGFVALVRLHLSSKQSGRDEVLQDQQRQNTAAVEVSRDVDAKFEAMSDDDVLEHARRRMHDRAARR